MHEAMGLGQGEGQYPPSTQPINCYSHAVNVNLEKDRKHVRAGNYTARVKTPTKTGVEVKINGHRISSKLFDFVHRSDGYDYSFAVPMSV